MHVETWVFRKQKSFGTMTQRVVFSIKSDYHLGISLFTLKEASSSIENLEMSLWKFLFGMLWVLTLPKTKHCVSRIVWDIIPTKWQYCKESVLFFFVLFCRRDWESTSHVLWNCSWPRLFGFSLSQYVAYLYGGYKGWLASLEFWRWMVESFGKCSKASNLAFVWVRMEL